jgi:hypothetical protein
MFGHRESYLSMKQIVPGDGRDTWKTPSLKEASPADTTAQLKIVAAWTITKPNGVCSLYQLGLGAAVHYQW